MVTSRRNFIKKTGIILTASSLLPTFLSSGTHFMANERLDISLAQWSLHRMLKKGDLKNLDFPAYTKKNFSINAVEYVNQFFKDKAKDQQYLKDLKDRSMSEGVKNLLIMIDGEGSLGVSDKKERKKAVENHYKWVEAAQFLGCHSIRVNAYGQGEKEAVAKAVVKSLKKLSSFAKDYDINILVENHGGFSSDGQWLSQVMDKVNMPNCGTLPDFGNFTIDRKKGEQYDRYKGVEELTPYAKAMSAKCYDFDEQGNETTIDFKRMLTIVTKGGYSGYVGIEYEGKKMSEVDGVKAAKKLLDKTIKAI
ncbi:MAG: TIM barrel protein [Bacteroidota bacterium]